MNQLTSSQITERYVRSIYPCLDRWITFIKQVIPYSLQFDANSCMQLSLISKAAMKTFDYIQTNDENARVIRVSRLLNDLYDSAWRSWTSFYAQSNIATGTKTLTFDTSALKNITTLSQWDTVMNANPSFQPPSLLDSILQGVKL